MANRDVPKDDADMHIQEVNLGGVIKGNKVALLHMAKSGRGGVIINTASMAGLCFLIPQTEFEFLM